MKTTSKILLLFMLIVSINSFPQAILLDEYGYYNGKMEFFESANKPVIVSVELFSNRDGIISITGQKPDSETTIHGKNITTYNFIKKNGVLSESQTWTIVRNSINGNLYVYYMRVVENGGLPPWIVAGIGTLVKKK